MTDVHGCVGTSEFCYIQVFVTTSAEILVSEVDRAARNHMPVRVNFVDGRSDQLHFRKRLTQQIYCLTRTDQGYEHDVFFFYVEIFRQLFDSASGGTTRMRDRIHQQDVTIFNIARQAHEPNTALVSLAALLGALLNENLTDTHALAAFTKSWFHRFTRTADADAADVARKIDTSVQIPARSGNNLLCEW